MEQFEKDCLQIIRENEDWEKLEEFAVDELDNSDGKSTKAYFYLGVALYKQRYFDQSIKAFSKSSEIYAEDAQLQYNLGLAYFKEE